MAAGTLQLIREKHHLRDSPDFCFVTFTDGNRSRHGVVQGTIVKGQSRSVVKRDRMIIAQIGTNQRGPGYKSSPRVGAV